MYDWVIGSKRMIVSQIHFLKLFFNCTEIIGIIHNFLFEDCNYYDYINLIFPNYLGIPALHALKKLSFSRETI